MPIKRYWKRRLRHFLHRSRRLRARFPQRKKLLYLRWTPLQARRPRVYLRRAFSQSRTPSSLWYKWRKRLVRRRRRQPSLGRLRRKGGPLPKQSRWRMWGLPEHEQYRSLPKQSRWRRLYRVQWRRHDTTVRLRHKKRYSRAKKHRIKKSPRFQTKKRSRSRWWKLRYRAQRQLRRLRRLHRGRRSRAVRKYLLRERRKPCFRRKKLFLPMSKQKKLRFRRKKLLPPMRPRYRRKGYLVRKFLRRKPQRYSARGQWARFRRKAERREWKLWRRWRPIRRRAPRRRRLLKWRRATQHSRISRLRRNRQRKLKYLTSYQQKCYHVPFIRPRYIRAYTRIYTKRATRRQRKRRFSLQQSMDFFFVLSKEPKKNWVRRPGKLLQRLRRRRGCAKRRRLPKFKHKRRNWTIHKPSKRWWHFCRRVRPTKRYRGARSRRPLQRIRGRCRFIFYSRYRKYRLHYRTFFYHRTLSSRYQEVRLFLNRFTRRRRRLKRRRHNRRRPLFRWRRQQKHTTKRRHRRIYTELRRAAPGKRGFLFRLPCKPRTRREFELSKRIRYRPSRWNNTLLQKHLLQRTYSRGQTTLKLSWKLKRRRRRRRFPPKRVRRTFDWRKTTKYVVLHLLNRRRWKSHRQRRTFFRQYLKQLDIILPEWVHARVHRRRLRRRVQIRSGYHRRQRVFRLRSDHNRWYKPRTLSLPIARHAMPHRALQSPFRRPNLIFRRIKTYHPAHKMFRAIKHRRPRKPLSVLYPYRVLRFCYPPRTIRWWRKKRRDRSALTKLWAPHARYSAAVPVDRFTLHTTPDQDIRNRSVLDLGRIRFRTPSAARRHRASYHYAVHRHTYRLLRKRGRRLSKLRYGVRSTPFLRKQRLYLNQTPANASLSRYHRRLPGFVKEGSKRYFLPAPYLYARFKATRRLLPILHAALWRYRNSRQFRRLHKRFLRRRRGHTRTPFLLRKRRRRRRGRRILKRIGKQRRRRIYRTWTFDLYKGLKVSGRSYIPYNQRVRPRRPRSLRKRTFRFRSGYTRRTHRATRYAIPHLSGLTFQYPTRPEVPQAHDVRPARYARTAVYSDMVRDLYPILLRRFLPKVVTANTVNTTYWGMRASDAPMRMRDAAYHCLRRFRYNQEARRQYNRRAEMLHLLQSRHIWIKPSSYWRRRHWLRRYNRRRYDFYVEDKERFRAFLSPRRQLFLSRPSPETHWRCRTFLHPRQRHAASVVEGLIERRAPESTRVGYHPQQTVSPFFARAYSTHLPPRAVRYTPALRREKSPRNRQFYARCGALKERQPTTRLLARRRRAALGRERAASFHYYPRLLYRRRRARARIIHIRRPIVRVKKFRKLRVRHPRYNPLRHNIRRNRIVLWNSLFAPWARKDRTYRRWLGRIRAAAKYSSWKDVGQMCREELPERTGLPWRYFLRVCKWFHPMPLEEQWPTFKPEGFVALRRRRRRMEWREPDERFRKPYFELRRNEYRRAPWLQGMLFRNTIYSRQRWRAFRRDNGPRKQKRFRWLHKYCAALFRGKKYLRRWPRVRILNNRNFQNFLGTPRRSNQRLASPLDGLANRLDVTVLLLNLAPSIRWARFMARAGVLSVNGKRINREDYRLAPGDYLRFNWKTIRWLRGYFTPHFRRRQPWYNGDLPKNITYLPALSMARFNRLPKYEDLPNNSRLNARLFRWYYLDNKR